MRKKHVESPFLFYCSKEAEVAAEDVIANMKRLSWVLHEVSHLPLPYVALLGVEADQLDVLIEHPDTVEKIYQYVESGLTFLQSFIQFCRDNNLLEIVHYLTTSAPR